MNFALLFIYILCDSTSAYDGVPVIIMHNNPNLQSQLEYGYNPFSILDSSMFLEQVQKCISLSDYVVIVVEEALYAIELSLRDDGGTVFPRIQAMIYENNATYYPAVEQPFYHLTRNLIMEEVNVVVIDNNIDQLLVYHNDYEYFYYIFNDSLANMYDRQALLHRHDRIVYEIYESVKKVRPGNIAIIYTGRQDMEGVEFEPVVKSMLHGNEILIDKYPDVGLFYFKNIFYTSEGQTIGISSDPTSYIYEATGTSLLISFKFKKLEMRFLFTLGKSQWSLDKVMIFHEAESIKNVTMYGGTSWGRSYACGDLQRIWCNNGMFVSVPHYQIELYPGAKNAKVDAAASGRVGIVRVGGDSQMGYFRQFKRNVETDQVVTEAVTDQGYTKADADGDSEFPIEDDLRRDDGDSDPGGPEVPADFSFADSGSKLRNSFNETDVCMDLMTVPILCGLVVMIMTLAALACGVGALMDLGVHDKWDDQAGPRLVVDKAGEAS